MRNVEQDVSNVAEYEYYANVDFSHDFWQLPLDENSQECQSFIAYDGVFTPTRVLHGTINAVTYLQSTLAAVLPRDILDNVLYWLDDVLVHHKTIEGLLDTLERLFGIFKEYKLKLRPEKCCFFATTIRWCGRLLSKSGIRFEPRCIEGIRKMELPKNVPNLQQFLCALQLGKTTIPNFTSLIEPLHSLFEQSLRTCQRAHITRSVEDTSVCRRLGSEGNGRLRPLSPSARAPGDDYTSRSFRSSLSVYGCIWYILV